MSPTESLRDVIDGGVELTPDEAVAVAQQLIASPAIDAQPAPAGPLSLDMVRLGADGSVTCIFPPRVSQIGTLLAEMLPHEGTMRVPGALRYTIARALSEVDAPAFDSVADLSAALARHERRDRGDVLRNLYARAAAKTPTHAASDIDRRRRTPSAATLRRQLREADEKLFAQLQRTAAVPAAPSPAPPGPGADDPFTLHAESAPMTLARDSFSAATWAVGATLALLISFSAGYMVVAGVRATQAASPATEGAASAATPTTETGRRPSLADATPTPGTAGRSDDPRSSPSRRTPRR